ncbi:MAG: heavy metal translocating P-type ATPase [Bacillota bacterium]|nr:heavy metal translocating P-type ATPase [Bacillota bacterium]
MAVKMKKEKKSPHSHKHCGCGEHDHHTHSSGMQDIVSIPLLIHTPEQHHHEQGHHMHEQHHEHHHEHDHEHHHEHHGNCCNHETDSESPLDEIGCGCSGCAISPEQENTPLSIIKNIPILYRILASLALFGLGFLHPYFFLISYAVAGSRVLVTAIKRINILDEFFLMSIASVGAIAIGEFPEAAAVMILFEIGEFFKDKAVDKSKNAISNLLALRPKNVTIRKGSETSVLPPESVEINDILIVKVGERIALDGILLSSSAEINHAAITGESAPVLVVNGGEVLSGGVVVGHPIEVKVAKKFHDSTISKIIALVQDAKESKTSTEQFITKFAKVYTPLVVLAAIAMVMIPTLLYGGSNFEEWLHRGLIFLVVSCPCALVISVPLSYFAGIGKSSSLGVLFKGSSYLDAIASAERIVFDKTGTLTTGDFEVCYTDLEEDSDIWNYVFEMEKGSIHPLAVAIKQFAESRVRPHAAVTITRIKEHPGMGLHADFQDGNSITLGNAKLVNLSSESVKSGVTAIYVGRNNRVIGKIELSDKIREDSAEAVQNLKKQMKTTLLSGDREDVTALVANSVKIDEFHGSLLPVDKYEIVKNYVSKGESVIFVGDGINDAPVLAGATIGIAMGLNGSDAAIEASDAVLMKNGISAIPTVIRVSKHTKRIVIENIALSLTIKAAVLSLSALGLANMWLAVASDVGAALIAVLNTLRITARKY